MQYPSTATVETTQSELVSGDVTITLHADSRSVDQSRFTLHFSADDGHLALLERYTGSHNDQSLSTTDTRIPVVYDENWTIDYRRIRAELTSS